MGDVDMNIRMRLLVDLDSFAECLSIALDAEDEVV